MNVVCIMTVHNRRELTMRCLGALSAQSSDAVRLSAVVVDDGSTDGTSEAIRSRFPDVTVVPADGSLFWGAGMALAEAHAQARGGDALLWLNDDIDLDDDAVARLVAVMTSEADRDAIVVGALRDPENGRTSYSGWRRRSASLGLVMAPVEPDACEPRAVDSFNGNLVLVPRAVAGRLGGVDRRFRHHYGDLDYGLRAQRIGVRVLLAPGTFGSTSRNPPDGTFLDRSLPRRQRVALLWSPKGFPPREKWQFLTRHGARGRALQWAGWYAVHLLRIAVGR